MMAAPAMHSFMSHLFAEVSLERREDGFAINGEDVVETDDEEKRLPTVARVVYQMDDIQRMIKIVQDNAAGPSHPLSYKGHYFNSSLDLSNSETRWSNDTSIEKVPAEETSITNKPRFPRRRLSVEEDTAAAAASAADKNNEGLPRYPQRKATIELISPPGAAAGAASAGGSSNHKKKQNKAPAPPRKPQRKGTIDLSDSIEEEEEEEEYNSNSSLGAPPPPKRLVSNHNETGTVTQNNKHCDGGADPENNASIGSPTTSTATGRYSRRERVHRHAAPIPASANDDLPPRRSSGPKKMCP